MTQRVLEHGTNDGPRLGLLALMKAPVSLQESLAWSGDPF